MYFFKVALRLKDNPSDALVVIKKNNYTHRLDPAGLPAGVDQYRLHYVIECIYSFLPILFFIVCFAHAQNKSMIDDIAAMAIKL